MMKNRNRIEKWKDKKKKFNFSSWCLVLGEKVEG